MSDQVVSGSAWFPTASSQFFDCANMGGRLCVKIAEAVDGEMKRRAVLGN